MAIRRVRGVLIIEDSQTGDGRVWVPGSVTWQEPPLPLAYLADGDQHVGLVEVAPQVGTIDTIVRAGNEITWQGGIDDEIPAGAELLRRLTAGTASHGARNGLSIDGDDWAVQLIDTDPGGEEETVVLLASGAGPMPPRRALAAAAGDPAPQDGAVLFEDASDTILESYTRTRIRGATACAVQAFTEAWVELDGAAEPAPEGEPEPEQAEALPASAHLAPVPALTEWRPPVQAFLMPEPDEGSGLLVEQLNAAGEPVGLACPLTIDPATRLVFGHLGYWGQCHIGYPLDVCPDPPRTSLGYRPFYHGPEHFMQTSGGVLCDDGTRQPAGPVTVSCDHAVAHMRAPEARDYYAHAGLQWADVAVVDGQYGPWACGALRADVTDPQVLALQAGGWSGDWRDIGGNLELIGVLAVTIPGFPLRRAMAASGMQVAEAPVAPVVHFEQGRQVSLVAAGVVQRCPECQRRAMQAAAGTLDGAGVAELLRLAQTLERRTRHLVPAQATHDRAAIDLCTDGT